MFFSKLNHGFFVVVILPVVGAALALLDLSCPSERIERSIKKRCTMW